MRAPRDEQDLDLRRKAVHVGCGLIALSFRWLSWEQALLLALAAFAFNALLLPLLGGHALHRPGEKERGYAPGILLYPLAVAGLVLAFGPWKGLVVPAMGWALLAFGDGAASLVGMRWGRTPLPWNARKSWEGTLAHVVFGGGAAAAIGSFVAAGWPSALATDPAALVVAAFGAAAITGLLETIDSGIDDNLKVAWAGGMMADALLVLWSQGWLLPLPRTAIAFGLCLVLAVLSVARGSLTLPGAAAALLMGTGMAAWSGWGGFATLCAFFALGVGATRVGRRVKEERGIAEARGGRRGFGNVVANGGMALLCAFHAGHGGFADAPGSGLATGALVALVAALATAAFDTVSSEIGKAHGRTTVLITSFRRVPPGTEGAVSAEGTLAGAGAALAVGLVGLPWMLGRDGLVFVPLIVIAALIGTTFESVVGALFERDGRRLHNDLLNFANTLVGALAAAALLVLA